RGGDDGRPGPRELEQRALEGREARLVQVLDDLDDRGSVEAVETLVPVEQRAVDEPDALALLVREPAANSEAQLLLRDLQRAQGHIHSDDLRELLLPEERLEQLAFSATQVEHALGARFPQRGDHGVAALLVEAERPFELDLRLEPDRLLNDLLRILLDHEALERRTGEALLMGEVTTRDGLALRVGLQPAGTVAQQLLHL